MKVNLQLLGRSSGKGGSALELKAKDGQLKLQPKLSKPLPPELIEHIFDQLDDSEGTCLRQLSLTARCFLVPARVRLFQAIIIKEEDDSNDSSSRNRMAVKLKNAKIIPPWLRPRSTSKLKRLAAVLQRNPGLGTLVRDLIFQGWPMVIGERGPVLSSFRNPDAPIPFILSNFPNLESISFLLSSYMPPPFFAFSASSCAALVHAVQSPKMRKIVSQHMRYGSIQAMVLFLRHCVSGGSLEEISITCLADDPPWVAESLEDEWEDIPVPQAGSPSVLRTLRVEGMPLMVETVLGWIVADEENVALDQLSTLDVVGVATPVAAKLVDDILRLRSGSPQFISSRERDTPRAEDGGISTFT
ncbi:hypothetical protein PQX77_018969 [Marasmius sp. AFHP31]|nr:hypothetical protein PQX77_018969 [Marasmius sp. AFHP31]